MPLEMLGPEHDVANDDMVFILRRAGYPPAEVIVPRSAIVQGEPFVRARAKGWFRDHEWPEHGMRIRIDAYQFNPNFRQPEGY